MPLHLASYLGPGNLNTGPDGFQDKHFTYCSIFQSYRVGFLGRRGLIEAKSLELYAALAAPGDAIAFLSLIPTAATQERWLYGGHSVRLNFVFIEILCAT